MYSKSGRDFNHSLTLSKDSTFVFVKQYFEVNSKCQGRWHYITKNTLLLVCDTENLTAMLSGGHIPEKKLKAYLLGYRKVRLQNVILTRAKSNSVKFEH